MSKKIEKESVSYAVNESSKLEELMKAKQKLIKQITETSMKSLREYKEKVSRVVFNAKFLSLFNFEGIVVV